MEFKENQKPWAWVFSSKIKCTVCGDQVNAFGKWHVHPRLNVIQCPPCHTFYHRGRWSKDEEGYFEHCRWCGEGGDLLGCDECVESFCKKCIKRNFGRNEVTDIQTSKWRCFVCDTEPLKPLLKEARKVMEARQQREQFLIDEEERLRKKKLQKKKELFVPISTRNISPHSETTNGENGAHESTDEDEIDEKIHLLMKRLQFKIENPDKSRVQKEGVKGKIEKLFRKFQELKRKSEVASKSWPQPEKDSATLLSSDDGGQGGSSGDESEDALFGLTKKRRRKEDLSKVGISRPSSSDEYSDEESAVKIKEQKKLDGEKRAEKAKVRRDAIAREEAEKEAAEEEKRKIDNERIRQRKAENTMQKERIALQNGQRKVSPKPNAIVELSDDSDEKSQEIKDSSGEEEEAKSTGDEEDGKSNDSPREKTQKKSRIKAKKASSENGEYSASEKEGSDAKESSDDDLDFLDNVDNSETPELVPDSPGSQETDDELPSGKEESEDEDVEEKLAKKAEKSKPSKKKVSPIHIDSSPEVIDSEDEKPLKKSKKSKDALLKGKIDISSDDDFTKAINNQQKKGVNKKRKHSKAEDEKSKKKRKKIYISSDDGTDEAVSDAEEEPSKKKRKKRKKGRSDDDESGSDKENNTKEKKDKIKSRKIMSDEKLSEETKAAELAEKERKIRLEKIRSERLSATGKGTEFETKEWSGIFNKDPEIMMDEELKENLKSHQVDGCQFMWDCTIESVTQVGNKFTLGSNAKGHGCILAHCMGLGKTLQSIALMHTLYTHEYLGLTKFMVLAPLNVCENWGIEVDKWTGSLGQPLSSWNLQGCTDYKERLDLCTEWSEDGGILVLGYSLFRMLTTGANVNKKAKRLIPRFKDMLLNQPDVVICDEGHMLKNSDSAISKTTKLIKTTRRIVLTGTPMQNNLDEYHCMVDFVRPNLLGTNKEFRNRFANPIRNGESIDASDFDVKLMKKRAFILAKSLDGVVQRKDYSYMCQHLPPKHEYVLSLQLTEVQQQLYEYYLKNKSTALVSGGKVSGHGLFGDFQTFLLVNNHPRALLQQTANKEERDDKEQLNHFVAGDSDSEEEEDFDEDKLDQMDEPVPPPEPTDEEELAQLSSLKLRTYITTTVGSLKYCNPADPRDLLRRGTEAFRKNVDPDNEYLEEEIHFLKRPVLKEFILRKGGTDADVSGKSKTELRNFAAYLHRKSVEPPPVREWYEKVVHDDLSKENDFDWNRAELSIKIQALIEIINICYHLKDKLIVFSQSVLTLDTIEGFLHDSTVTAFSSGFDEEEEQGKKKMFVGGQKWYKNIDYFRIDGSVNASKRTNFIDNFNNMDDPRARLFLVSTKAGGIGTNLIGANRVIIFDSSWNPAHDVQSLFRVYRFGQLKNVFVYRFVGHGTMEEKIYERQVNKSSLGLRVVDEQQIDRHYSADQLKDLYQFMPKPVGTRERLALPKDDLLKEIITHEKTKDWICRYHEHDSLLEHKPEENLTKDEIDKAWEEYENEKKGIFSHRYNPAAQFQPNYGTSAANLINQGNDDLIQSSNWIHGLSNHTLQALLKIGNEMFKETYKDFFTDRHQPTIHEITRLFLSFNPTTPYIDAVTKAHHLSGTIKQMFGNERSVYQNGLQVFKLLEERLQHLKAQTSKVPIKAAPKAYFQR